jgi:hypothetical protein
MAFNGVEPMLGSGVPDVCLVNDRVSIILEKINESALASGSGGFARFQPESTSRVSEKKMMTDGWPNVLLSDLSANPFALRPYLVRITKGIHDNVSLLPDDSRSSKIRVLVQHKEESHRMTSNA